MDKVKMTKQPINLHKWSIQCTVIFLTFYRPILRGLLEKKRKEIEHEVKLCWINWMGWFLAKIFHNI